MSENNFIEKIKNNHSFETNNGIEGDRIEKLLKLLDVHYQRENIYNDLVKEPLQVFQFQNLQDLRLYCSLYFLYEYYCFNPVCFDWYNIGNVRKMIDNFSCSQLDDCYFGEKLSYYELEKTLLKIGLENSFIIFTFYNSFVNWSRLIYGNNILLDSSKIELDKDWIQFFAKLDENFITTTNFKGKQYYKCSINL